VSILLDDFNGLKPAISDVDSSFEIDKCRWRSTWITVEAKGTAQAARARSPLSPLSRPQFPRGLASSARYHSEASNLA
jgi:hypothetical protein